ncbi:hypothetical protein O3M35_005255 [Rhynocoris fuscipes]|uniref:Uncharacterized protein n=1 Tax=Rhynocoris fuscipes TaxID=488301 RepID=A0AAW1DLB5_9HEMI
MSKPNGPGRGVGGRTSETSLMSSASKRLVGTAGLEVDNLIVEFNDLVPTCDELLEKYKEDLKEENEKLLHQIQHELTITQEFVKEQDDLLSVYDAIKTFNESVERFQNESFERQKHTLTDYLEVVQKCLILTNKIREKVKNTPEAAIYEDYMKNFLMTTEEQITIFEDQEKKLTAMRTGKKVDLVVRVAQLLLLFKEGVLPEENKLEPKKRVDLATTPPPRPRRKVHPPNTRPAM